MRTTWQPRSSSDTGISTSRRYATSARIVLAFGSTFIEGSRESQLSDCRAVPTASYSLLEVIASRAPSHNAP
ncbi:uncharacterized protein L969DRAFT_85723 [Mixia osmundae IAM 14324]|uniref:uncharacterized protein n=1 Tax=Mixia osmundae (strain CBS 9802 / IAM 14324 / JCM 22182 / KY 12970) TaxID=764103 RepID=UPI0004A54F71|nr:uncharacterized protein L969DRAFT_85723 [Mixia osmundae IAM 14324]KEI40540.1 hypothetical protein L969DRAFT_85723 [Mixia osmundae IAM 14324]